MAGIVIQKFGGTSINNQENRNKAADLVIACSMGGKQPVVIVSAAGRTGDPYATDTLLDIIKNNFTVNLPREQDLLLACGENISACLMTYTLNEKGYRASALTGSQAGIITNGVHNNSRALYVDSQKLHSLLADDIIPVITGFQGISVEGEVTTLGRGGSDTSAAIIAAALQAESIEIFTDVSGIMSADPRVVKDPTVIQEMNYEDLFELAIQGARVIHPRAAEIAKYAGIPIKVRSTFTGEQRTTIHNIKTDKPVISIVNRNNIAYVKIQASDNAAYQHALNVFSLLSAEDLSVDFIDIRPEAITFVVDHYNMVPIASLLKANCIDCSISIEYSMISVIGAGMTGVPGIMSRIVQTLQHNCIEIYQTTDSHSSISVLIKKEDEILAVNALHQAFEL